MKEEAGANVGEARQTHKERTGQRTTYETQVQAAENKGWNCPATRLSTAPPPPSLLPPPDLHYSPGDVLCWPDLWLLLSYGDNIQRRAAGGCTRLRGRLSTPRMKCNPANAGVAAPHSARLWCVEPLSTWTATASFQPKAHFARYITL